MPARICLVALLIGAFSVAKTPLTAQQEPAEAAEREQAGGEAALLPDESVVTTHSTRIEGQTVRYTATAGWLPIREDGVVAAKMFFVAYTRDDVEDLGARPLVFSFNGGPGTASVWMHLGYTGPRRVVYDDEGFAIIPPGTLEDNPHAILDVADIVYIDPVATGYSRMVEGQDLHRYHGTQADIESVGEFIRLYLVRESRWQSPKFLIGESYGTTRASGLAGHLARRHRIYLNGIILVSMTDLDVEKGDDIAYATTLPQLSATAWYHRQLPEDLHARQLQEVLDEAERFAMGEYLAALVQGDRIADAERDAVARGVARLTGVTTDYVLASNLRIDSRRFWKELLRDQRLTVGRLDSRYLGIDRDAAGEHPEYDPAMADWNGAFSNAINRYLRDELRYQTDLAYNVWGDVRPWKRDEDIDVAEMLRQAMRDNPYLKVLIQGGYFDAATDYFGAMYTISHLQPGGELRNRFRFAWYESGHMMYLRRPDLQRANDDVRAFVRWSMEDAQDYPRRAR